VTELDHHTVTKREAREEDPAPGQASDMSEYLGVFLDEAGENLDILERGILRLEDPGSPAPEILQEMFRAAHTLKGSSRAMGFTAFGELTHRMEDLLDGLRNDTLAVSGQVVDTLLKCLDVLNSMKASIESGADPAGNPEDVLRALDALLCPHPGKTLSPHSDVGLRPAATYDETLSEGERLELEQAEQDENLWLLRVAVADDCPMKSVRAMMVLTALGEISRKVRVFPSQAEVDDETFESEFAVLLCSESQARDLEEAATQVSEIARARAVPWNEAKGHRVGPTETEVEETRSGVPADPRPDASPAKSDTAPAAVSARRAKSVRVDVEVLDDLLDLVGELVVDRTRLSQLASAVRARHPHDDSALAFEETVVRLDRTSTDIQEGVMKARMLPVEDVFNRFPRMVRDLAHRAGREIELCVQGGETELDRSVIELISDPLIHLLRNCVDHGIEAPSEREAAGKPPKGTITISASHRENRIAITVSDDGRGIDPELLKRKAVEKGVISPQEAERMADKDALRLVFAPGFSTAEQVTDVSGRGVGMDVVSSNLHQIGGQVRIESRPGDGTCVRLTLPLTLAIIRALLVEAAGGAYAIPLACISDILRVAPDEIRPANRRPTIIHRDAALPLLSLQEALFSQCDAGGWGDDAPRRPVVVVQVEDRRAGLVVDQLIGEQEIVIKPLGKLLGDVSGISGAAVLGDGSLALVIDVPGLVSRAIESMEKRPAQSA
jgi:two-component system chemotaxis sensor kinase CheA